MLVRYIPVGYKWGMVTLAQYLKDNKIKQEDFAERIGRTQAMVSRLVSGKAQPSPDLAADIEKETSGEVPFHVWPAYSRFAPEESAAGGAA